MTPSVTLIIMLVTVAISLMANSNIELKRRLLFNAFDIKYSNEWYRWITHGFVHGDFIHLAVNMWVFYMFGQQVEQIFDYEFGIMGKFYFLTLYLAGVVVSSISAFIKHQDNPGYNSLGASGAVASVLFAFILYLPTQSMGLIFLPGIRIPAFLMGLLYLWYEYAMDKRAKGRIAHDAHFWGAVFGIIFMALLSPATFANFFQEVGRYVISFIS